MNRKNTFKKPTIKGTSRAYVRLFEYYKTEDKWLYFLGKYQVKNLPFGNERNGDCAIRVIDPSNGMLAELGLEIPSEIKYHTYTATGRCFWNEHFIGDSHVRNRTIEIGYPNPTKDEVLPK